MPNQERTTGPLDADMIKEGWGNSHDAEEMAAALNATLAEWAEGQRQGAKPQVGENWWDAEAIEVIRHARVNEPHAEWSDWQNAITNGLLRAYNRGQDSAAPTPAPVAAPQCAEKEEIGGFFDEMLPRNQAPVPEDDFTPKQRAAIDAEFAAWKANRPSVVAADALIEECVKLLGGAICSCDEEPHRHDCQLMIATRMRALRGKYALAAGGGK